MNWSDEQYVKVYKRETLTILSLDWDARSVLRALLIKLDGAGVMETGNMDQAEAIALQLRAPVDVVRRAMPALIACGTVVEVRNGILLPNFVAAQEATKTERLKKADQRQREADQRRFAQLNETTDGDVPRSPVVSRAVPLQPSPAQPSPPPPPAQPTTSPAQPSAGAHSKKIRALSRQEFLYEQLFVLGRKVAAGADCPPDETHSPAFINKAINAWLQLWPDTPLSEATIKLLSEAGADLRTEGESRLEQLFNAYFEATWPADCKRREGKRDTDDPQPYPFRVLTSEKVWGELVAQLWPSDDYARAWPERKLQLWPEKSRGAA